MILGICEWWLKTHRGLTDLVVLAWRIGHGFHDNEWLTVIGLITIVMSLNGHTISAISRDGRFGRDLKMWVVDIKIHTQVRCEMWMYVSSWRRREAQWVNLISEEILHYNTKDEEWDTVLQRQRWRMRRMRWRPTFVSLLEEFGESCNEVVVTASCEMQGKGGIWCGWSRFVCSSWMTEPWYRDSIALVMNYIWLFIAAIHHNPPPTYTSYSGMGI